MKYYIATYYQYDNYGTRLQNYALVKALEKIGIDVNTIYIVNIKSIFEKVIKNLFSLGPIFIEKQKIWVGNRKKEYKFRKFNSNLKFNKIKFNDLKKIDTKDSVFIVGSDQVWSPKHFVSVPEAKDLYFLNFVKMGKCFSYAPSFGSSDIPNDLKKSYIDGLKKFKLISVRENAGKKILNQLGYKNVEIMPDPVFLLDENDWLNLIHDSSIKYNKKYILTYFLGKIDEKRNQEIINYANRYGYDIINICGNYFSKNDFLASPEEFLKLISCSELVFTDSFHASAFSIIFKKQFFVIKRNDVKQFSRLETLLSKYSLTDHILYNNQSFENIEISDVNYNNITKIFENEKNKGLSFLEKIVDNSREEN